jgi:autotransporter-associated beta strand protein
MKNATILGSLLGVFICLSSMANAAVVWTGPTTTFTDIAGSDPTQAVNQDRLTSNVWIARGSLQGIYNAEKESGFTHFVSPKDTEWADGTTAGYASLTYTDWNTWAKIDHAGPPSTVGVNAVMHLITDDIYLDVTFTSWGGSAGGFAYERSTPASTSSNLVWTGSVNGTWDVNTSANFRGNASGMFSDGDNVTFDSTGSNPDLTIAASGVAPGSVIFSSTTTSGYSLSGGPIKGATGLLVSGGGSLLLSNSNTYTGDTLVTSGVLELANVNALADGANVTVGDSRQFAPAIPSALVDGQAPTSLVAPVPEPGTAVLFAACAMLLAIYRRASASGMAEFRTLFRYFKQDHTTMLIPMKTDYGTHVGRKRTRSEPRRR